MKTLVTDDLYLAATWLLAGEPVAFPTETVYGLGAPIFLRPAIARIFEVKKRPADNPLIAHISQLDQIEAIAENPPDELYQLAEAFFPGPLTIVTTKAEDVPDIVSKETIAFRMPAHPTAKKLIELVGSPLVAPSANLSGKPSPTCASHVLEDLDGHIVACVDGGPCTVGIESTVVSLLDPAKPALLRPGVITSEAIEEVLKRRVLTAEKGDRPLAPGMKYRHYAPQAKVLIFHTKDELERHLQGSFVKRKVVVPTHETLYGALRASDREGCDEICFICDENIRKQVGLMNRLLVARGC